ncbi:hypothetical protein AKJ44_02825 [candidate division MSBL1 archaeon SCGC-AAA261F17]|uniref:Inorganic phosphate transporter n=1 Tax=candidate division MSBL1 archaeon SCGC-AAA261F17 TaxID=1698274 RepID=A0A133V421_9EURY|nr:hypothetical protein AKJ44_02825 [candidate division MSBL1 archaeon SCGC-AAA261F17]
MSLILVVALIAIFYVAWNIGTNDAGNAMGTAVGGRVLTYRRAVAIMIIFVALGAVLEGWKVMETVGTGIVTSPEGLNPLTQLPLIAAISMIAAGLWVTIASIFGMPVSTHQSIIGAIMGAGILISALEPSGVTANVEYGALGTIALCWVFTPIGAAIFAFIIYKLFTPALRRMKSAVTINRVFGALVVAGGAFTAYSLGANGVGTATAVLYAVSGGGESTIWSPQLIALFGGVALAIGALTYSRRVMRTVGSGITRLDAPTACAAQFGAALTVWSFTQFGMPVSTSQSIVGGVLGVGLVKGIATVSKGKLGRIGVAWILTPLAGAGITLLFGWIAVTIGVL